MFKVSVVACGLILSGNLTVRSKEEPLLNSLEYVIPQEKCFDAFLSNLKNLDAIIYIPESKINEANSLGLFKPEEKTTLEINKKLINSLDLYTQIIPEKKETDACSKSVLINFRKLGMIVFVKTEKLLKQSSTPLLKWENATVKLWNEANLNKVIKIDNAGEKLKIKLDNNTILNGIPVVKIE